MSPPPSPPKDVVLVTGGSSFLGGHTLLALLSLDKYTLRTTVRTASRVEETRQNLLHGGATPAQVDSISILVADLLTDSDATWFAACTSAKYVIHVAGKIPTGKEKKLEELSVPLQQGATQLLTAAKAAGVKRVVFTSSIATLAHGHGTRDKTSPFTEEDWTDLSDEKEVVHIYPRAKTLTEKLAWEFVSERGEGQGMELAVVCPAAMYGPSLNKDYRASLKLILILCGGTPGMPYYGTGMVGSY
jgi:nucleoside-diphosphate-sugar epimerase